jgi:hypothetical protein
LLVDAFTVTSLPQLHCVPMDGRGGMKKSPACAFSTACLLVNAMQEPDSVSALALIRIKTHELVLVKQNLTWRCKKDSDDGSCRRASAAPSG